MLVNRRRTGRSFERLESRSMLAGDVSVQILNGDAILIGDSGANNIFIQGDIVTGRNDVNGVATSINGVPNGSFDFSAYTRDLIALVLEGNDIVEIEGVNVPRQLVVDTDDGSDLIQVNPVAITSGQATVLWGGTGSDRILVNGVATSLSATPPLHRTGLLAIDGNTGNDEVRVSDVGGGQITIDLGFDADLCELRFAVIDGTVAVNGWHGYDSITVDSSVMRFGSLKSDAHQGTIVLRNSYVRENLGIRTNAENDFVLVEGTRVDKISNIDTNDGLPDDAGQEYVLIRSSVFSNLRVRTGGGSDRLEVASSIFDYFYATLEEDADWLFISYSTFNEEIQADGGSGFDLLTRRGSTLNGFASNNFEAFDQLAHL